MYNKVLRSRYSKCKSNKSCLTVGTTDFNYQGAAWAAPIAAQSNSIYSNGLESAGLLEGQSENQARSINKKIDSLKKSDKYKKKMSKVKGIETKLKAQALKRFRSLPAANQQNALAGISSQTQTDTKSPKEILKEAEKLSKRKTQSFSTGKKAKAFDLDFGDSNNTGIEIQDDVAQVMDKEFKIKGDINNNPDHNIFKILSNRYKSTGLKRLFDEK